MLVEEPELPAREGENHAVLRDLLHELRVVVASRFGPVTPSDQEEVANRAGLHRLDHLVRNTHDRVPREAHHHRPGIRVLGKPGQGKGLLDHRRKVAAGHVRDPRPPHQATSKNLVPVGFLRLLDAVGRHHDRTREGVELLGLVLPGGSVVAAEVGMLLQLRIPVAGKHLPVRVYVDSLPLALLENLLQVLEVVAGNQDGLSLLGAQGDLRGNGMSVRTRVARVEKLHGPQVDPPAFQNQADPVVQAQVLSQGRGHAFMNEVVHNVVLLAENPGVVRIRGHTPDPEGQDLLERTDVRIDVRIRTEAHLLALLDHLLPGGCRLEGGRAFGEVGLAPGRLHLYRQFVPQFHAPANEGNKTIRIEIHIGECREDGFAREDVRLPVFHAHFAAFHRTNGQPLDRIGQKILQGRHIRLLAAYAYLGAPFAFCSLLALVTEHVVLLPSWVFPSAPFPWGIGIVFGSFCSSFLSHLFPAYYGIPSEASLTYVKNADYFRFFFRPLRRWNGQGKSTSGGSLIG